jgi:hypothetical protein
MAPLCPPMRAMGLTCAGAAIKKGVVVDGEIKIQDMINCTSTRD